ncbi:MAG: RHS repeat-associated core domain-containing protein [Verrucomicrobiota bacterium]
MALFIALVAALLFSSDSTLGSFAQQIRPITYVYDGNGNRVSLTTNGVTVLFLVDDRNPSGYAQVLEELIVSGGATNLAKVYSYGLDLIAQRQIGSGTVSFYGYDGNGNTRYLAGANGIISDTYAFDAFGTLLASSGSTANNYLYTGEQYDPNLGFYYLRARYLNPGMGRFWTRDIYWGSFEEPLSLHKYNYTRGNPVNMIDPSGLFGIFKYSRDFGIAAHRIIESEYQAENPGAIVGPTTGVLGTGLKPDIFDGIKHTYQEIKPLSLSGVAKGMTQIAAYDLTFTALGLGYSRGTWPDGVRGSNVGLDPIAYFNVAGVIFYTDMVDNLDDLAGITSFALAREYIRRGLVGRTLTGAMARIPGLITARGVADTGRLESYMGIAGLLGIMGGF